MQKTVVAEAGTVVGVVGLAYDRFAAVGLACGTFSLVEAVHHTFAVGQELEGSHLRYGGQGPARIVATGTPVYVNVLVTGVTAKDAGMWIDNLQHEA